MIPHSADCQPLNEFYKIKSIYTVKEAINKTKRQPTAREKIFATDIAQVIFTVTVHFCCSSREATIDNVQLNRCGWVPIKFHLWKQYLALICWPLLYRLLLLLWDLALRSLTPLLELYSYYTVHILLLNIILLSFCDCVSNVSL